MGTTTLLSFEEFEQLPDEPGKVELLDGELIQLPPAKYKHMEIAHRIHALLVPAVGKAEASAKLGRAYLEMGYKFGTRAWLQPDVSISYRDQPRGNYFESAPA
jgi:Uma2 family endonuclease